MKNIKVEGFEFTEQLVGTSIFTVDFEHYLEEMVAVTIEVFSHREGGYYARPDIAIRDPKGYEELADRMGNTPEEAVTNALEELKSLAKRYYANDVPEDAFINVKAEAINDAREYEKAARERLQVKHTDFSWRNDKLCRHRKSGPYLEYQLEQDGTYTNWHEDSIFVGNAVFDPLYTVFCRQGRDFGTHGTNLYSVKELAKLKEKVTAEIARLEAIETLSDFVDSTTLYGWIWEPDQPVWRELRDAMVEFLVAVKVMIEQGEREQRALFVLGV